MKTLDEIKILLRKHRYEIEKEFKAQIIGIFSSYAKGKQNYLETPTMNSSLARRKCERRKINCFREKKSPPTSRGRREVSKLIPHSVGGGTRI